MLYRLSAITTINLTDLDGAELAAGSVTELLEPTGAYSADDLRGSDVLESAITGGTAILFGPNNRVLNSIKSTGVGNIVGLDSDDLDINSINAGLIQSGGTDLYNIFVTDVGPNDITRVQPGTNTITGGTDNLPSISLVDSPSVNGFTASGTSNFTGVIQSGGTDLYSIFSTEDTVDITRVQPGLNITTGGTDNFPLVNLADDISLNSVYGTEMSGGTLYSGSTELSEVIDGQISTAIAGISVPAFDAYDSSGGLVSVTTAWSAPIPLNTQRKITSEFSHSTTVSNSQVTINETDTYFVFGRVSTEASFNSRTQGECRLELDAGGIGSWANVPGTTAEMYLRQNNYGATGTFFAILDLTAGDKLRMNMRRQTGGASVTAQAGGSSLIVLKAKGPKGDKGDTGTSTGITHDRQAVYLTATTSTTSTTPVDLNGMSITTKDLGGPGTYLINFSCSRGNTTSNLINNFYISVDGVRVRQSSTRSFANEIHIVSLNAVTENITSGTVIKIEYDAQGGGTHTVLERDLTIDGVLDANVKQ